MDPANVDWSESVADRRPPTGAVLEDFLFQNIRRIVREEIRAALAQERNDAASTINDNAPSSQYLTIAAAADIAEVHPCTIREWIKDGSMKAFKLGRTYRLRRSDLDARLTADVADPTAEQIRNRVDQIMAKRPALKLAG
jgi:excisionase family DNA binding protein